jgi:hypothetical protein
LAHLGRHLVDDRPPFGASHVERERVLGHTANEPLGLHAVLNELGNPDDEKTVPLGEAFEVGLARHRAIVVHDLADDSSGRATR